MELGPGAWAPVVMVMVAAAAEVVGMMGAVGVLGWAAEANSCFLTEEGVGWVCVGPWALLLPGDVATGAAVARETAGQVLGLAEAVLLADCSARADDEVA